MTLYHVAAAVSLPMVLPLVGLHPRLRGGLAQRLGGGREGARGDAPVWLHGSSAGDVAALIPLGHRLEGSGLDPVYSAWTRSGDQLARRRLGGRRRIFRAPLDLRPAVGAVLDRLRPAALVLECLELWPALVSECVRRGIPVAVVNGRLSAASLRGYHRARWLFGPCFRALSLVTALTEDDARRFVCAGVRPDRVFVEGSSKHAGVHLAVESGPRPPGLVLGSIHRGEEPQLLPWLCGLLRSVPGLEVTVAPRYPHRAPAIRARLGRLGASGVTVVDTMGSLVDHYRRASVAFVGGSLVAHGGHNLVEAAAAGAAVLVGPHLQHCREEAQLLVERGGAAVVCDGASFYEWAGRLLRRPEQAARMAGRGRQVVQSLAGAADRTAARLLELVCSGRGARP